MARRNWKNAFQAQGDLNGPVVQMLELLEDDLTTALGGNGTLGGAVFSHNGDATIGAGALRYPLLVSGTITGVVVTAGTAPTGADLIVDVNVNGTTIFTTQANRPRIVAGSHSTVTPAVPDNQSVSPGDYISVDIDQIGSGVAGADLVVVLI